MQYDKLQERLDQNLERVSRLVTIYEERSSNGSERRSVQDTDLLRAAVVFLHATLEDLLRSVASYVYPTAPAKVLDSVPVVGSKGRHPEKFLLGELAQHRDKGVQELIDLSVQNYLEHETYNNTNEIAALIRHFGGDVSLVDPTFSELQKMMNRRHQIVHRADQKPQQESNQHCAESLTQEQVDTWIELVKSFADKFMTAYMLS